MAQDLDLQRDFLEAVEKYGLEDMVDNVQEELFGLSYLFDGHILCVLVAGEDGRVGNLGDLAHEELGDFDRNSVKPAWYASVDELVYRTMTLDGFLQEAV